MEHLKAPFLPSRPAPSSQATMTINPSIDITVGNLHQNHSQSFFLMNEPFENWLKPHLH